MTSSEPAVATPAGPSVSVQRSKREIYIAMSGLMLGMLLAMLDNMIVSTALPTIVGDLGGLAHLSWVVTAYTLGAAVSTPILGKAGDLYGRKGMFMASIAVFLVGSALAGMSQNMDQLIAFRAVQGLASGGLMVGAMAILGDLVPPRDRGRYQGLIGAMMPIAFVGGPLLGGLLTEHASWRWVFYVNLPVGALALVVTAVAMKLPKQRLKAKIDYTGVLLLSIGLVALTLLASWGGNQYSWGSWEILGLGVVSVVSLVSFVFAEMRVSEPVLPPRLFRDRNFTVTQVLSFILGATMFGAVNFLPQYMQYVQGASPTVSGLLLLPLMFGMLVVMIGTGQYVTRTGRYRVFPILGGAVITIGMVVLLTLNVHTSEAMSSLLTIFVGIGMGFVMQLTMLITQNSAPLRDMGAASGSVTLFRTIGGSLGIALLGSIYTRQLTDTLEHHLGSAAAHHLTSSNAQIPPSELSHLATPLVNALKEAVTSGLHGVLVCAAILSALSFVIAFFIRHVPLRGSESPQDVKGLPQDVI